MDLVHLAEGHRFVAAVHARRRREHKADLGALLQLGENVERAAHVDVFVQHRIEQARAHAGHRGQVNHAVERAFGKQLGDERAIANVAFDKARALGLDFGGVMALDRRIVEVVEVVQHGHGIAALEQRVGDAGPNETGTAGEENFRGRHGLLDGHALGQVARLVNVAPAQIGVVVTEQLQRNDVENR